MLAYVLWMLIYHALESNQQESLQQKIKMLQHVVHNKCCHCLWVFMHFTDISYFNAHKNHTKQILWLSSFLKCSNQYKLKSSGLSKEPWLWERESPMYRISHYQPIHTIHNASVLNYNTTLYRLTSLVRIQISEWTGRGKITEVKLKEDSNFKDKIRTK